VYFIQLLLICSDGCCWLQLYVVDVRDALVGVGLILNENGNFSFDKGLYMMHSYLQSDTLDLS